MGGATMHEAGDTLSLLRDWNGGDQEALNRLLDRHLEEIRRYVKSRLGPMLRTKADTIDYVQDAMVEFLRYGPRFEIANDKHFRALLGQIIENVLRDKHDWYTAKRRQVQRESPMPDGSVLNLDPSAGTVTQPPEAAAQRESEMWMRLGLELLAPDDRRVIVLREYDGKSFAEIAAELGIQEDAARARFHRALPRLAAKVKALSEGRIGDL